MELRLKGFYIFLVFGFDFFFLVKRVVVVNGSVKLMCFLFWIWVIWLMKLLIVEGVKFLFLIVLKYSEMDGVDVYFIILIFILFGFVEILSLLIIFFKKFSIVF